MNASTLMQAIGMGVDFSCKTRLSQTGGAAMDGFGGKAVSKCVPISCDISDEKLRVLASSYSRSNGVFIGDEKEKVSMGILLQGGIIVSDQFAGCDLTIFKNPAGVVFGAHVYSNEECRACIRNLPVGWSEIVTWKSKGYVEKWPGCAVASFAFVDIKHVQIVIIGIGGYPAKIKKAENVGIFDR